MNTFKFGAKALRTVELDGQPWFVGVDVLRCLTLPTGNGGHYDRLAPDEQTKADRTRLGHRPGKPMVLVSESGLYKLIMRSDKAEAKVFQEWVTRDVLPSIRRTGGYLLNEHARGTAHADSRDAMPVPAEVLAAFTALTAAIEKQTEVMSAMLDRLSGTDNVSPIAPPVVEEWMTARQLVQRFGLAGARPTLSEFNAMVSRTAGALSTMTRSRGMFPKKVMVGTYPTNQYPKEVVEAFLG